MQPDRLKKGALLTSSKGYMGKGIKLQLLSSTCCCSASLVAKIRMSDTLWQVAFPDNQRGTFFLYSRVSNLKSMSPFLKNFWSVLLL